MTHPTTQVRVVRTAAIARLVLDVQAGAAITPPEAHRRLRVAPSLVGQYMEGVWREVPPEPVWLPSAVLEELSRTERQIAMYLAARCGRFVHPDEICRMVFGDVEPVRAWGRVGDTVHRMRAKGLPVRIWRRRGYAIDGRELHKLSAAVGR